MTNKERIKRLKENGFNTYHLFGNWYIGRKYSKNYKRFSFYTIFKLKEEKQNKKDLTNQFKCDIMEVQRKEVQEK